MFIDFQALCQTSIERRIKIKSVFQELFHLGCVRVCVCVFGGVGGRQSICLQANLKN